MSRISYYNHEGYRDPTAYAALNSAEKAFQQKQHEVRCSVYKNNPYRPLVFICSPFAGEIKRNVAAARQYCKFAVSKGNIPFAPHLLFVKRYGCSATITHQACAGKSKRPS